MDVLLMLPILMDAIGFGARKTETTSMHTDWRAWKSQHLKMELRIFAQFERPEKRLQNWEAPRKKPQLAAWEPIIIAIIIISLPNLWLTRAYIIL